MVKTIWNTPLARFLSLRSAMGPMQRLVVGGLFGFIAFQCLAVLWNEDKTLFWLGAIAILWVFYCFDAARFADAALPRWLAGFTVVLPLLALSIYLGWIYLGLSMQVMSEGAKALTVSVLFMTLKATLVTYVIPISLLMIFLPSRLYSDKGGVRQENT